MYRNLGYLFGVQCIEIWDIYLEYSVSKFGIFIWSTVYRNLVYLFGVQCIEIWDIYLEYSISKFGIFIWSTVYLTTRTSMHSIKEFRKFKRYSLLLEDIKKRVCMPKWACDVCMRVFFTLTRC